MSKTIVIPSEFGNPVTVLLNGVKYTYKAGATETVPDEVAALFESNAVNAVKHGRHATAPLTAPKRKGEAAGTAVLTDDDGNLYIPTELSNDGIYVDGHMLIIPYTEG